MSYRADHLSRGVIQSLVAVLGSLYFVLGFVSSEEPTKGRFAFGAIADCQYCAEPGNGLRKYALSVDKLKGCVSDFNTMDLEYVVHLGDFIDKDWESFDVVNPIYEQLSMPSYHVLGNHDFSVADDLKSKVPEKLGMPSTYYDFVVKGWRFVVLDGNDVSFHAYPAESDAYAEAEAYYNREQIRSPKWNGAVGSKQLEWLREVLNSSEENDEPVILFCHFPVYPENNHNLWNAGEVIALLEEYSCVKAYVNGHNHKGHYGEKNGIHYVTLKGMVDTERTAYAVIRVGEKRIQIKGFGREENRLLDIRAR